VAESQAFSYNTCEGDQILATIRQMAQGGTLLIDPLCLVQLETDIAAPIGLRSRFSRRVDNEAKKRGMLVLATVQKRKSLRGVASQQDTEHSPYPTIILESGTP